MGIEIIQAVYRGYRIRKVMANSRKKFNAIYLEIEEKINTKKFIRKKVGRLNKEKKNKANDKSLPDNLEIQVCKADSLNYIHYSKNLEKQNIFELNTKEIEKELLWAEEALLGRANYLKEMKQIK